MMTSNIDTVAPSPRNATPSKTTTYILVDIVSATLEPMDKNLTCNTFCILCDVPQIIGNGSKSEQSQSKLKVLHQSGIIKGTNFPIWTINDGSLYLLQVQHDGPTINSSSIDGAIEFQVYHSPTIKSTNNQGIMQSTDPLSTLSSSSYYIGSIKLLKQDLVEGNGIRKEFKLERDPTIYEALTQKRKSKESYQPCTSASFVTPTDVLNQQEYEAASDAQGNIQGTLALRFRIAHQHEIKFMVQKNKVYHNTVSTLFSNIGFNSSGTSSTKTESNIVSKEKKNPCGRQNNVSIAMGIPFHEKLMQNTLEMTHNISSSFDDDRLIKVKPYPDPNDVSNTEWLDKEEIEYKMLLPSTNWIEAGKGDTGTIFIEILKCDNLPNLDSGHFGDLSDPFIAMVFEDNLMRTDVIDNELSPRWMPWTHRAFAFQMKHPGKF